jgi:hypothetical protein
MQLRLTAHLSVHLTTWNNLSCFKINNPLYRNFTFNPAVVPWGLCDPGPLCLTFCFWNCREYWHNLVRIFSWGLPNNVTHIC